MNKILALFIIFISVIVVNAQEKKIPLEIIKNDHLTLNSYLMIRWITWSEDQKIQIYDKTLSLVNESSSDENKKNVEEIIKKIAQPDQLKEFETKVKAKEELSKKTNDLMKSFNENIEKIGGLKSPNLNNYDTLNWAKHFYFDSIWAISRTPLSKEEQEKLFTFISKVKAQEAGVFTTGAASSNMLNQDKNLLEIQLKKDYGTEYLIQNLDKILTKNNQEIYKKLFDLYTNQKKSLKELYMQYSPILESGVKYPTPLYKSVN